MSIIPTRADLGRRVIHNARGPGVLETTGGTMCDVRFDDGRLQLVLRANLTWADAALTETLADDEGGLEPIGAIAARVVDSLADAYDNTPSDSGFSGDGGSFGGGGAEGDY